MTTPAHQPDLIAWLRARLDDDERAARAWLPLGNPTDADRKHIARHDPARVLAEVDAKRRVLDRYEALKTQVAQAGRNYSDWIEGKPDTHPGVTVSGDERGRIDELERTLRLLALPYAGHPGYRSEWTPA